MQTLQQNLIARLVRFVEQFQLQTFRVMETKITSIWTPVCLLFLVKNARFKLKSVRCHRLFSKLARDCGGFICNVNKPLRHIYFEGS